MIQSQLVAIEKYGTRGEIMSDQDYYFISHAERGEVVIWGKESL